MKILTLVLVLAVAALVSGIIAACKWYRASKVMVMPMEEVNGQLRPLPAHNASEWIQAVYLGLKKSGALNKSASLWTAASVILAAASVVSTFASSPQC